jgi:hypothetical protein
MTAAISTANLAQDTLWDWVVDVTDKNGRLARGGGRLLDRASLPLLIATVHREEGITGVHTHVRQLPEAATVSYTVILVTP